MSLICPHYSLIPFTLDLEGKRFSIGNDEITEWQALASDKKRKISLRDPVRASRLMDRHVLGVAEIYGNMVSYYTSCNLAYIKRLFHSHSSTL